MKIFMLVVLPLTIGFFINDISTALLLTGGVLSGWFAGKWDEKDKNVSGD